MQFEVRKTSDPFHLTVVVAPQAHRVEYLRVDQRTVPRSELLGHPTEIRDWYLKGVKHTVNETGIVRYFPDTRDIIELVSLDNLLTWIKMVDEEVIVTWRDNDIPLLEIYDDYRE